MRETSFTHFHQRTRLRWSLCVVFTLSFAVGLQSTPESHSRIELIADQSSTSSGHPLWVGLLFHLDPGWHVYWQNAGDSGQPPTVQWSLPPGFHAGAIQWPTPERLGKGSVIDYGYENQVLLMAPIRTPAGQKSSGSDTTKIELTANVKYLVCREICVPAKASVALSFPLDANSSPQTSQWQSLFQQTRAQLPKQAPANWEVSAQSDHDHFVLSVHATSPVKNATFLPLEASVIENSSPQIFVADNAANQNSKNSFQLTLKKSDQLVKQITTLKGVLVLDENRSYEIAAPVASQ